MVDYSRRQEVLEKFWDYAPAIGRFISLAAFGFGIAGRDTTTIVSSAALYTLFDTESRIIGYQRIKKLIENQLKDKNRYGPSV